MATNRKDRGVYQAQIRLANHPAESSSFSTKKEAQGDIATGWWDAGSGFWRMA